MSAEVVLLRNLAEQAAVHPKIKNAVSEELTKNLPGVIEEILSAQYGGQHITMYIPKRAASSRRDRNQLLRAKFTGRNTAQLASEFKMSIRQVMRICCPPKGFKK